MNMLNRMSQFCQDYYNQIPAHSLKAIGLSAAASFFATIIFYRAQNISPLASAKIAIIASTIHALITPMFNYIFANNGHTYNSYQEFCQIILNVLVIRALGRSVFNCRVGAMPSCVMRIAADIAFRILPSTGGFIPARRQVRSELQDLGVNFSQTTPIYCTFYV